MTTEATDLQDESQTEAQASPESTPVDIDIREQLAAIEHERWASWQAWLHSQLKPVPEGLLMSPEYYEHLEYQIAADYSELSDKEKASDMEQVDRYWPLILKWHRQQAYKELISLIGEDTTGIGDTSDPEWESYATPGMQYSKARNDEKAALRQAAARLYEERE